MPYGGSVWVVLAFPAPFIFGQAKFRSILPLPMLEYRVTSLLSPQPFLPFFPAPQQPNLCCSQPRCGKQTTQVSLLSGGSTANWIVKDDPATQLSAKLGPSDTG